MDRIVEAEDTAGLREKDGDQQHEMYEKTLQALEDVTPDDDDEGLWVVTDWIIEEIRATGERPNSRAVRQRAQRYSRENGHPIRNSDWLGR